MPGLFDSLNLASRSLQTQQQGVAVSGQNLANVNNPAYARQRLTLQASTPIASPYGPTGTGVEAVAITQMRDALVDRQIQGEASITASLQAQQTALQYAEAGLGEQLDASSGSSASSGSTVGTAGGLNSDLNALFNAFQGLSAAPASIANRQTVISQAQQLAGQFNQVDQRLNALDEQLNQSVQTDVSKANSLLSDIAGLNQQIAASEASSRGTANDLRDLRQQKLEQLANLVNFQSATTDDGALNLSLGGNLLVAGGSVEDTLQTFDAGSGQLMVRTTTGGQPLALTGGSVQGAIEARDNTLKPLTDGLNNLAAQLISQVNTVYHAGYDLHGNTGANFFSGTGAGDIAVNATLLSDPATFQAAGLANASGDNQVVLALGQLASTKQAALGSLTFSDSYNSTITGLGSSLASVNTQLSGQQSVQTMLQNQRNAVSGVSIDEEMTNLVTYQRAFEASAHLVSTIDQMLNEVINLKQ